MSRSESPFLDLPAELRLQIYADALAPTGTLFLTRTQTHRAATRPALATPLLRVSRQVHREVAGMLLGLNEVAVALDVHNTAWPVIAEARLPQPVLERLEHLFLVLDCSQMFFSTYRDIDFTALEALTSLRTLRLAIVYDAAGAPEFPCRVCRSVIAEGADVADLIAEVLARVPRRTKVMWDVSPGTPQMEIVEIVLGNWRKSKGKNSDQVRMIEEEHIAAAVAAVPDDVRGSKSGGTEDVFAEYYERYSGKAAKWHRIQKTKMFA